jgi:hypothetical protein
MTGPGWETKHLDFAISLCAEVDLALGYKMEGGFHFVNYPAHLEMGEWIRYRTKQEATIAITAFGAGYCYAKAIERGEI